MQACTWTGNAL